MKRRYCVLAILLMALMLTACGGNTEDSHKESTTKETNKGKNEVTTSIEKPSDLTLFSVVASNVSVPTSTSTRLLGIFPNPSEQSNS